MIAMSSDSSKRLSVERVSIPAVSVTLMPEASSVRFRDLVTFVGPKAVRVTADDFPRVGTSAGRVFVQNRGV